MGDTVCPRCGGTSRRHITPSYVECTENPLVGIHQGPAGEVPVYQECGHRYQVPDPSTADRLLCSCGRFAIGVCLDCGTPADGEHGQLYEGRFLCAACVAPRRQERARQGRLRQQAEREAAQQAEAAQREREEDETPGLRVCATSGLTIAAALHSLAPSRTRDFAIGTKYAGFAKRYERGWGFILDFTVVEARMQKERRVWRGIVIFEDGRSLVVDSNSMQMSDNRINDDLAWGGRNRYPHLSPSSTIIPVHDVALIRNQVLAWLPSRSGRRTSQSSRSTPPPGAISLEKRSRT